MHTAHDTQRPARLHPSRSRAGHEGDAEDAFRGVVLEDAPGEEAAEGEAGPRGVGGGVFQKAEKGKKQPRH